MEKDYDGDSDLKDFNTTFILITRLDMNISRVNDTPINFIHLRGSLNARSFIYNWGDAIDPSFEARSNLQG